MKQYVIGIDGGGTKTELIAVAMDGNEMFRIKSGPLNVNGTSEQNILETLTDLLSTTRQKAEGAFLAAACIGAAGMSNPKAEETLRKAFVSTKFTAPLLIVGDHQAALAGALGSYVGMLLIAGTGSICCGRNESGCEARTGGQGHLIDDEGSGYAIGRDILRAVVRAQDGRLQPTILTELVFDKLGITTTQELIANIYRTGQGKEVIAGFSSLLPKALAHHDAAAIAICKKAASELFALVIPVAHKLDLLKGKLALSGSVLLKDEAVREALLEELAHKLPELETVLPLADAASGAALLARNDLNEKVTRR